MCRGAGRTGFVCVISSTIGGDSSLVRDNISGHGDAAIGNIVVARPTDRSIVLRTSLGCVISGVSKSSNTKDRVAR